jgi:hypothetical protein
MSPITAANLTSAFPYIIQVPEEANSLLFAGKKMNFYLTRHEASSVYVVDGFIAILAYDKKIKGAYHVTRDLWENVKHEERCHSAESAIQKLCFEGVRLIQITQYNK